MVPLLHIVCFGRRWEVTLRFFLTRSKFILSTPSYCLKHRKSPQIKDSSLPAMCPNHWAEHSALLGSKPEFLLHYFSWIRGESPIQSPVVKAPSEEVTDMGLNWWIHTFCFLFKSMLITRPWYEMQRVLPLSHQYSAWVSEESGRSRVWEPSQHRGSGLVAALPLAWEVLGPGFSLDASLVKFLRLGVSWQAGGNGLQWEVVRQQQHRRCWWGGRREAVSAHHFGLNFLQMLRCKCNMSLWELWNISSWDH